MHTYLSEIIEATPINEQAFNRADTHHKVVKRIAARRAQCLITATNLLNMPIDGQADAADTIEAVRQIMDHYNSLDASNYRSQS